MILDPTPEVRGSDLGEDCGGHKLSAGRLIIENSPEGDSPQRHRGRRGDYCVRAQHAAPLLRTLCSLRVSAVKIGSDSSSLFRKAPQGDDLLCDRLLRIGFTQVSQHGLDVGLLQLLPELASHRKGRRPADLFVTLLPFR